MAVMGGGCHSVDRAVVGLAKLASREGEGGTEAIRGRHEEDCTVIRPKDTQS